MSIPGAVGAFPGMNVFKRRQIKAPINPYDKATVVSIYPKPIKEYKCTIQPGLFEIDPGTPDKPTILIVGPSSWWREIDDDQPLLEIPVSAIAIAESIVKDYCNGVFGCDMDSVMPGLFYVPGAKVNDKNEPDYPATLKWIQTEYAKALATAVAKQKNFWSLLVRHADSLWARSNGNPLALSDDMRLAARQLGLNTKDWLKDFQAVDMVRCKACGALKNPDYPVCAQCHFPDPEHPMTAQILAAQKAMPKQA